MKSQIKRYKQNRKVLHIIVFILLLVGAMLMFFPFYWAFIASLKTKNEFWLFPPTFLPQQAMWSNYREAMQVKIPRYIFNSVYTACCIVIWQLISSAMAAYAFARYEFKAKKIVFGILMLMYMLPAAVTHVPTYVLLSKIKLIDTYSGLILSNCASIFAVFLMRQYFLQVDKCMIDAASIDGASDLQILWSIMIPLSKPAIIIILLNGFILNYNNYVWPQLITRSPGKYLVSQGLRVFFIQESAYGIKFPQMMAANIVVMAPTLILFAFTQKWFESGISDTGLKG